MLYYRLQDENFSEEELERHINNFDINCWFCISKYQRLSESFIEKYKDLVNWFCISKHQKLSESFILNHLEDIKIYELEYNKHIPKELFEKTKLMKDLQS
jgi:hypothetical protein